MSATPSITRVRVPLGFQPRDWARAAYGLYLRHPFKDFAVNACPGAGKTKFAVMLAYNELARGAVDRVDVVGPSTHICEQWMREMASWGVHLDPENPRESRDCVGRVATYQRLGVDPEAFRLKDPRRTLVILDEIHHAGDSRSWGDALRNIFAGAKSRLLLSGTPFRSDNNPIPFVRYAQADHGSSVSDYTYGYGEALRDGYCAPLYFPHHDGEFAWDREGKKLQASFDTVLRGTEATDRLRTALEPTGEYARGMLEEAHAHLLELRKWHKQAAGIVFGRDVANVQQLAQVLTQITGKAPITVTNDDADAGERIRRFRRSSEPWIVSVKMISEGVDIPRLRVGVFLSNVRTELFFRQAAGRLVRLVEGVEDQTGYLYIPSDPKLVMFASDMQRERKHYLQKKALAPELPEAAMEREPREEESEYRFLQATGERRGVIDIGPLLESSGQRLFEFAVETVPEVAPRAIEPVPSPLPEAPLLHERKGHLRKRGGRISGLVKDVHTRLGVPFKEIHRVLNARQKVRSQSACTVEQLEERENLLGQWLQKGRL